MNRKEDGTVIFFSFLLQCGFFNEKERLKRQKIAK